jgi:F420-dependent oxidoreductase-like protein
MPKIKFGVKTGQGGYTYKELKKVWSAAEQLGYDSAWLYDHFYSLSGKDKPCLEAWTTLSALAAATKRLRIGTMVTSVSYRHPALLAKMATTVDIVSDGRLILGMGAGWHEEEYRAYGYEFPDTPTRVRQLKEALIVIRRLWTEDRASFNGKFYPLRDAISLPKPRQKMPKILVGIVSGRKTMPYLAVRLADGFNTMGSIQDCQVILNEIRKNCEKYERRFEELEKSWQGFVIIGSNQTEVEKVMNDLARERDQSLQEFQTAAVERGYIIGEPDDVIKLLRELKEMGINHFLLAFPNDTSIRPLEVFKDQVISQIR